MQAKKPAVAAKAKPAAQATAPRKRAASSAASRPSTARSSSARSTSARSTTAPAAKRAAALRGPATEPLVIKTSTGSEKRADKTGKTDDRTPKAGEAAKLVRDSFTMPALEFGQIATLKERAIGFGRPAKKSELLRAGLKVLSSLDDATLRATLDSLAPLKPGRPRKS
jgi:hypothetical protein